MSTLEHCLEQLSSLAVLADPTDLPALAQLHSHFQRVGELARQESLESGADREPFLDSACSAEKLIERIILAEEQDAQTALARVGQTVSHLQALLAGQAIEGDDSVPVPSLPPGSPALPPASNPALAPSGAGSILNADDLPLVREFVNEAGGHLEAAEAALLQLDKNAGDIEALNALFRAFHTIKGVAGFLNLGQIGALAHAAESLLDLARKGQLPFNQAAIDLTLESADLMKVMVLTVGKSAESGAPIPCEPRLDSLTQRLHACASGQQSDRDAAPIPAAAPQARAADTGPSARAAETAVRGGDDTSVKVATARLDNLINMVGELVIASSMVQQDVTGQVASDHRLARHVSHLGKLTRELQELSMSMRMVPIQGVFQKMNRLVRDLSKKAGKQIDLVLTGGETELDRNVVEAIHDPLVHMVRNAADHGIEPPDARLAAGKAPGGHVELKAFHQAGNIVIQIIDDGRGLNKKKILKKAIDAGLVREGQELPEAEIFQLIFHPGLSTADKVTDVSGRGVGMDVVKRNVEALRGRIEIESVEGRGSTFTIRLPLTLAVIDGLVVTVGPERFILPLTSIEQSIRPTAQQISTLQNRVEMCMVRGQLLPLFRLHRLFNLTPKSEDPTESLVIIVHDNSRQYCLLVDQILGQQQVVIKSLGDGVGEVRGVSGGAILGDGNVSLILDVPGLVAMAR